MFFNRKFILASNSLSRSFILKNAKLNFYKTSPKCDEEKIKKEILKKGAAAQTISLILAKRKAQSISKTKKDTIVVGADTVIKLKNKIINKAKNTSEARKKLATLSGKKHEIYSSAAAYHNNKLLWSATQKTTVKIRKLNKEEIKQYLLETEKNILLSVGCFQIEKDGPRIIENIKGDFFNVMGFPLFPFLKFLKKLNIKK